MKIKVVRSMRLGNVTEDITSFLSTDPPANLAILDGYEVLQVVGPQKRSDPPASSVQPLCDLHKLGLTGGPHGITYIEKEKLFVVNCANQPTKLFLFDQTGQPKGIRTIQRTDGFVANHVEGLAYLPPRSPHFPDHIVMVAAIFPPAGSLQSRLEIIDRDGKITAAIFQKPEFLTGVTFKAPDSLLVSRADNDSVREIDFQGKVIRESKPTSDIFDGEFQEIEGLAQERNGGIAAVNFFLGRLAFLDRDLNLTALESIDFRIGPGLFEIGALAWDSTLSQHLLNSSLRDNNPPGAGDPQAKRYISAVPPGKEVPPRKGVPPTLEVPPGKGLPPGRDAVRRIVEVDAGTGRMTYLPDERLIAVAHRETPPPPPPKKPKGSIRLYNEQGKLVEEIDVSTIGLPSGIAYVPTKHQFVVRFVGLELTVLTRKGEFVRKIDLSATLKQFAGFAFFNPAHASGGQFVLLNTSADGDALIIDFDGKQLDTFKQSEAAIVSTNISAITTGPDAGAFAILDGGSNELVVFRLI